MEANKSEGVGNTQNDGDNAPGDWEVSKVVRANRTVNKVEVKTKS